MQQQWIQIPGGKFVYQVRHRIMEGDCQCEHGPVLVHLPAFEMTRYPVTNGMYREFIKATGYSGGGKKMIAQYEAEGREDLLSSPAIYGITQSHKHLPEMQVRCGLSCPPVFSPIVDDYYKGMATTVPLHLSQLRGVSSLHDVWKALSDYYAGQKLVRVAPEGADGKLYGAGKAGDDDLTLTVAGNDGQLTVTALFDNLGKGASGAAVQNMNLMLGFEETEGLSLS